LFKRLFLFSFNVSLCFLFAQAKMKYIYNIGETPARDVQK